MTWPAMILWLLIIIGLLSRGPLILYLFSSTVIFGALTMAPPALTGGLNLPAQTICAIVLLVKIFLRSDNLMLAIRQSVDIRKLGFLGFFTVYVVISAGLYPRLFGGNVMVYSLNAAAAESPLSHTSANFTQTVYLLISAATTFAFAAAARHESFRKLYLRSIIVAGLMLVASGVIDLALNATGGSRLLEPFHNAAYASLDTVFIAGQYRVVGFMPEASVYGAATCTVLSFLVFNFRYFETHMRGILIPGLILALGMMTLLSTSSTGYVGLIVLLALTVGRMVAGVMLSPIRSPAQFRSAAYVLIALVLIVAASVVIGPILFQKFHNLINNVLLDKASSSSYLERSRWSAAGLQAFIATYGFGVGVGSIRTSSWFINILASTGVIGTVLFGAFVLKLLMPYKGYANVENRKFANALKLSIIPAAVMIGISGTTPDPGVWVMSIFGILQGLRLKPQLAARHLPADTNFRIQTPEQRAV